MFELNKDKEYRQIGSHKTYQVEYNQHSWQIINIVHLKLLHGVRICGSFFTGLDFFLHFYKSGREDQYFIALCKLKITLAKLFSIQKSAKVLWLCFIAWALVQCQAVFGISSGGLNLAQECSKVFWELQPEFLLVFDILFLQHILYMYYFLFRCGMRTKFPEAQ